MGLPGRLLSIPPDGDCEDCGKVMATVVMQGETDSMGYEEVHLCKECHEKGRKEEMHKMSSLQHCDWCKADRTGVTDFRDPDEGTHGPVYRVCFTCRGRCRVQQEDELAYLREQNGQDTLDY